MEVQRREDLVPELFDYHGLRLLVGAIAFLLPIVLPLLSGHLSPVDWETSLSAYYYQASGDVFVGALFSIATFLLAYRGRDGRERAASAIACVAALGVALFPTLEAGAAKCSLDELRADCVIAGAHFASAAVLFAVLAVFCFAFFAGTIRARARRRGSEPTPRQQRRVAIYQACGATIVGCMVAIGVVNLPALETVKESWKAVLVLEAVALWAFGLSWLTAGKWARVGFLVDPWEGYSIGEGVPEERPE